MKEVYLVQSREECISGHFVFLVKALEHDRTDSVVALDDGTGLRTVSIDEVYTLRADALKAAAEKVIELRKQGYKAKFSSGD